MPMRIRTEAQLKEPLQLEPQNEWLGRGGQPLWRVLVRQGTVTTSRSPRRWEGSGPQGKRRRISNEDQAPPAGCRRNSKPLLW